jgi:glycosyltransferase involved in cell wall biosynthesis
MGGRAAWSAMKNEALITIFTPTYNRAGSLPALASSLAAQSCKDFEWIVVDDGSTDGTAELLSAWTKKGKLPLRVMSVANGGKHRAINRGLADARGELFFIVDSDDRLPPEALERISRAARDSGLLSDPGYCGIMGLKATFDGTVLGERLPAGLASADALALTYRYDIRGDKAEVFKTEVLRRFPFPEFEGERFITECVVWYRIARAGLELRLLNETLYEAEYQSDGLSARSVELRTENPRGTLLFYRELLEGGLPFAAGLREAANYDRFALLSHRLGTALAELSPRTRRLARLALPLGWAASLRDRVKPRGRA